MDQPENLEHLNQKLDYILKELNVQGKEIHALHRGMVMGRIIRAAYWFVVIGVAIGSFYFLQPYLENLLGIYGQVNQVGSDLSNFQNIQDLVMPR